MMKKVIVGSLLSLVSLNGALACDGGVLGDRNGDQYSDLTLAVVDRDSRSPLRGATTFLTATSPTFRSRTSFRFAVPLDALTPADFDGDCKMDYAGVRALSNGKLEWVQELNGVVSRVRFGNNGAEPHAGNVQPVSEDAEQRADRVVVQSCAAPEEEQLCWSALLSTGETVSDIHFGVRGDNSFLADIDGDNVKEFVVTRVTDGLITFFSRTLRSDTVTTQQWGERGDLVMAPIDLNGNSIPDYVVGRNIGNTLSAVIRFDDGQTQTLALASKGHLPMVGVFEGSSGRFAWYSPSRRRFGVLFSSSARVGAGAGNRSKTVFLVPPGGEALPPGTTVGNGPTGELGCDEFNDWGSGDTWKPSDTRSCNDFRNPYANVGVTNFTPNVPNRRGVANIVPAADYLARTAKVEILDYDGTVIERGVPRPGTPNGRYTVDFCPGPAEVERRFGDVVLRLTFKDGTTECRRLDRPNVTIRNGVVTPNRTR